MVGAAGSRASEKIMLQQHDLAHVATRRTSIADKNILRSRNMEEALSRTACCR